MPPQLSPQGSGSQSSKTASSPSKWYLTLQAVFWRFLMQIGMVLHRLAPPWPKGPAFTRQIPTTLSPTSGAVTLYFYTPKDYEVQRKLKKTHKRYPVVLTFHGGGFTLGSATDDARWATSVVEETGAVCVCVDYRLAPEFPFPTAVEDGVDAVLYIIKHAESLHLDPDRIAISGFSAGGNLTFTVPMRLLEEIDPTFDNLPEGATGQTQAKERVAQPSVDGSTDPARDSIQKSPTDYINSSNPHPTKGGVVTLSKSISSSTVSSQHSSKGVNGSPETVRLPPFKIVALVSWYPSCDYSMTRDSKRETLSKKDMEISPVFTNLFDSAYIGDLDRENPYLSPGVATEELLQKGLPNHIMLYTCEWDMLRAEAIALGDRLEKMGKTLVRGEVKGVPHGWDKSPNPFKEAIDTKRHYHKACKQLRQAFHGDDGEQPPRKSIAARLSVGGISLTGKHAAAKESPPEA